MSVATMRRSLASSVGHPHFRSTIPGSHVSITSPKIPQNSNLSPIPNETPAFQTQAELAFPQMKNPAYYRGVISFKT